MNILLYTLIFPPDVCSNAYVFADLAMELKSHGNTISVITTTPHYDTATSKEKRDSLAFGEKSFYRVSNFNGIKVFHVEVPPEKGNRFQRLKTFIKFHLYACRIAEIEKIQADVVISQTPPMTVGAVGSNLAKKLNAKSVFILQDLWLDSMIRKGKIKTPLKQILRKFELYEFRKADAVCTIADAMAAVVKPRVAEGKLHVIPNFVNTDIYMPLEATDEMRDKYGVSKDDFVLSYVGNVGNAQDLSPILDFVEKNPASKIKFIIAGNGIKYDLYKEKAAEKGLKKISFVGFVSREETAIINSISDVCLVMLAKHVVSTSFPSKIYTIMAMGKPIMIACSKGSVAGEFVEKSQIGWAVDTGDEHAFCSLIETIQEKPEEILNKGQNALQLVNREYSKAIVGSRYNDLCHLLVKHN